MPIILRNMVQRRTCHASPAYVPWLLIYVMTGLMFWNGKAGHSLDEIGAVWPGLIPLCVIGVQCLRPTILGWATIVVFAFLYNGFLLYVEFLTYRAQDHSADGWLLIVLLFVMFISFIVCPIAFIVAARPRALPQKLAGEPGY